FLAFSAAMEGRKAETLAAVQGVVATVPVDMVLAMGDSGWILAQPYAALVRFGLWDEAIALGAPDARPPGLTAVVSLWRGRGPRRTRTARGRARHARRAAPTHHHGARGCAGGVQLAARHSRRRRADPRGTDRGDRAAQ